VCLAVPDPLFSFPTTSVQLHSKNVTRREKSREEIKRCIIQIEKKCLKYDDFSDKQSNEEDLNKFILYFKNPKHLSWRLFLPVGVP